MCSVAVWAPLMDFQICMGRALDGLVGEPRSIRYGNRVRANSSPLSRMYFGAHGIESDRCGQKLDSPITTTIYPGACLLMHVDPPLVIC